MSFKHILFIFMIVIPYCSSSEIKIDILLNITKDDFPYLTGVLTQEEIDDWNNAQTDEDLKKAFLYAFYHIKNILRNYNIDLSYFNSLFEELEGLLEQLTNENNDIDTKIVEAKKEIEELKETLLKGERIEFVKFEIANDDKFHMPSIHLREQWNNAITTHELQNIFYSIVFSFYMAYKMNKIKYDYLLTGLKIFIDLGKSLKVIHSKSNELIEELINNSELKIEPDPLDILFGATRISDPEDS